MLPLFPPYLTTTAVGSNMTAVDHRWNSCELSALSVRVYWGSKVNRRNKNKEARGIWGLWHLKLQQTLNTVQLLAKLTSPLSLRHMYLFLVLNTTCLHFNKKITSLPRRKEKMLELSDREFKITVINILKMLIKKEDNI